MFSKIKSHLQSNSGDTNVSKMIMVAIVFVVGAILLMIITSAFNGPITTWFNNVITEWFADTNGEYVLNDPFVFYERNSNGTYKDLQYKCVHPDGTYSIITTPLTHLSNNVGTSVRYTTYNADGSQKSFSVLPAHVFISENGQTITLRNNNTYTDYNVQLPSE